MNARGFSLIEITAVLLILSIAAGAVALKSHVAIRKARMRDAAERVVDFDHLTRVYARRQDKPVRLLVDLSAGRISRTGRSGQDVLGAALDLPAGCTIMSLVLGEKSFTVGSVAIGVSRHGLSSTYALLLRDGAGREQWILFAGMTGEVLWPEDENELRQIVSALAGGYDAD